MMHPAAPGANARGWTRHPLLAWALLGVMPLLAPAQELPTYKVSRVTVKGNAHYSTEQIVRAAGMTPGTRMNVEDLERAANRLGETGAFTNLEYRYRTAADVMEVDFTVAENPERFPCLFDNFVWASDRDLAGYLARMVPLFGTNLPREGSVLEQTRQALESLLQERGVGARVEYMQSGALGSTRIEHVFSAAGVKVAAAELRWENVTAEMVPLLNPAAAPLVGRDVSRSFTRAFAVANLIPIYRQHGYLRARLADTSAQLAGETGVTLTLRMQEGLIYRWNGAEWLGNRAAQTAELERRVDLAPGEVADGLRVDGTIESVQKLYSDRGYLEARIRPEPQFDDDTRMVRFRMNIEEGPQYHMGRFSVTGAPPAAAERLVRAWRLKTGDVYNASYVKEFMSTQAGPALTAAGVFPRKMEIKTDMDRESRQVQVVLRLEM